MNSLQDSIGFAIASSKPPSARPPPCMAKDFMVREVITLRPDQSLEDAIDILVRHGFSGAPVMVAPQRVVGILSEFDCMKLIASCSFHQDRTLMDVQVQDVMSELKACIEPDADLFSVAHRFLVQGVRRLPVIADGRLLGLVTRRDLLRAIHRLYG